MKKYVIMILVAVMFAVFTVSCPPPGGGGGGKGYPAEVAKTGQIIKYADGDDGDLQMGVSWPDPRFTDNGDGTITDNLTGLMWEQTPSVDAVTWGVAMTHAADLETAGYFDWRLPNVNELESLKHCGEQNTHNYLHSYGFSNTMLRDVWWSSTSLSGNPDVHGWYVSLGGPIFWSDKAATTRGVICVRGTSDFLAKTGQTLSEVAEDDGDVEKGVEWPAPRFVDNGDGTISDMLTGLMWQKSPSTTAESWADALLEIAAIADGGHNDWRMPNIRELRSLVNYGESPESTWLENNGFENIQRDKYWSSTTQPGIDERGWYIDMDYGVWSYSVKDTVENYYIAVRDID
jgi:hypothetical protein